jgi:hypothetical protein
LLHLRGVIEARCGKLREGVAYLVEAAEASSDSSLTVEMLLEAAEAASFAGDLAQVGELGARAMGSPAASEKGPVHRGGPHRLLQRVRRRTRAGAVSAS